MNKQHPRDIPCQRRVIIYFAELSLKGHNRPQFVKRLRRNLQSRLQVAGRDWKFQVAHDRIFADLPRHEENIQEALDALAEVPGASWISEVLSYRAEDLDLTSQTPNLAVIEDQVLALAKKHYAPGKSFALRVKRVEKRFPLRSQELERKLGGVILSNTDWEKVNLKHADQFFYVDIRPKNCLIYSQKTKGCGGLPVSSSGRVTCLLSGGFDSPVAAFLMARRGCSIDYVHFAANNMQQKMAEEYKITQIARILSKSTGRSRLFLVPYTHFDLALMEQQVDYDLILFRRFMARVTERIAGRLDADALLTGDNLGQVASQTMANMNSMTRSVEMPIMRPLLAFEKEQIISHSRDLGLYDLSIEPYKDCCALISRSPKTVSRHDKLLALEARCFPNYGDLIDQTLDEAVQLNFEYGELVDGRAVLLQDQG